MAKSKTQIQSEEGIKGLASAILKEVIKAEMSMHDRQIEAWGWMAQNRPYSKYMDKDVLQGLSENKYLAMEEVNLSFYIKPVPDKFFKRLKLAFQVLRGKKMLQNKGFTYEFCSATDEIANAIEIKIKRNTDGSYQYALSKNKQVLQDIN